MSEWVHSELEGRDKNEKKGGMSCHGRYRGRFELARDCVAVAKRVKYSTRWWKRLIVAFVGRQRWWRRNRVSRKKGTKPDLFLYGINLIYISSPQQFWHLIVASVMRLESFICNIRLENSQFALNLYQGKHFIKDYISMCFTASHKTENPLRIEWYSMTSIQHIVMSSKTFTIAYHEHLFLGRSWKTRSSWVSRFERRTRHPRACGTG